MRKIYLVLFLSFVLIISGCGKKFKLEEEELSKPDAYPFYRGSLASSGYIENKAYPGGLDIIWEYQSNDKPVGPLTIYKEKLIYPGARNRIRFFDIFSGDYTGYLKPKGTPQSGMVISDSLAYIAIAPQKSKLKCINLLNRKTVWNKQVKDAVSGSIIIDKKLIIGSTEGRLYAFDKQTGETIWVYNSEHMITQSPTYVNNMIWQPLENGVIVVLDPENGEKIFSADLPNPIVSSVAYYQALYVGDMNGYLYKLNAADGQIVWSQSFGDAPFYGAVSVVNDRVYAASADGTIYAVSTEDASVVWKQSFTDVITASVLVVGEYLLFGTKSGDFYSLNISDGTVVEKRTLKGAITQAPVSDGRYVFVATDKGMITCFGERDEIQ